MWLQQPHSELEADNDFRGPHRSLEADMLGGGLFPEIGAVWHHTNPELPEIILTLNLSSEIIFEVGNRGQTGP